jgi:hypothetical protein
MIHTPLEGKWQNEPNIHRRSKARLLAAPLPWIYEISFQVTE